METDFCKEFMGKCDKFRWFIVRYYGEDYFASLVELAENGKNVELANRLNRVWFELPDNIFNIMENPPGWWEFLSLIEE